MRKISPDNRRNRDRKELAGQLAEACSHLEFARRSLPHSVVASVGAAMQPDQGAWAVEPCLLASCLG